LRELPTIARSIPLLRQAAIFPHPKKRLAGMKSHGTFITRRRFLKCTTGVIGAAMATPYLIPSGVLAAAGQPGANDRIGIGVVGPGRQGSVVLQHSVDTRLARVVAAADVNLPRAEQVAKSFRGEPYQDYRKLLDRKDVDAIITATPDHWRALTTIHACQAGKDVYAEKPMSLTIREGRLMVEAVQKYQRVFQTGSMQRSTSTVRFGCELVRNGRIGKLKKVIGYNYSSPWECGLPAQPVPVGLDWDMWCGPTEVVPYHIDLYTPRANPGWISFRPYSGGEMTGWGAHGLDLVQWALGMDDSGPVEVWTEGEKFSPPTYTQPESRKRGDDTSCYPKIFFRYSNDLVMELDKAAPAAGGKFIGEKGTIAIDRASCIGDPLEIVKEPISAEEVHLPVSKDHVANWLECIKTREKPICHEEVGHRSATVCHLGNIARWTGRRLRWDPIKEEFTDDAEANTYLDRQRRKPYALPETV
jgi:predicted dehydrogenase